MYWIALWQPATRKLEVQALASGHRASSAKHTQGWVGDQFEGGRCVWCERRRGILCSLFAPPPLETTYVTMQEDSWPLQPAPVK